MKSIRAMTRCCWCVGLAVCGLLCSGWSCEPKRAGGQYDLPSGWKLNPKRVQMLARSYPSFSWITMIIKEKDQAGWLFTTPHPRPPLPGGKATLMQLLRKRRAPLQPPQRQPPPRIKPMIGFTFFFRSSKPIRLKLVLTDELTALGFSRPDKATVSNRYTLTVSLPRTGHRWRGKRFLYKDFRHTTSPKLRPNPLRLRKIRIEASAPPKRNASDKSSSQPTRGESITLTVQGPFRVLGRWGRQPNPDSRQPPRSKQRTQPTPQPRPRKEPASSKPTSQRTRPTKRRPTKRPASQPKNQAKQ